MNVLGKKSDKAVAMKEEESKEIDCIPLIKVKT